MAKYGHHHDEVQRFLSRVKSLAESDWRAAFKVRALTSASFGTRSYHALERELEAYKEFGVDGANQLIGQAFHDASFGKRGAKDLLDKQSLVLEAVHGLLRVSDLSAVDFTRAYLPFENRIPVEELEFSSPPGILNSGSRPRRRLKDGFRNGHTYYALDGTKLTVLPRDPAERPSRPALEWHAAQVLR